MLITLVRWMPNVVLCTLAILVARDKLGFLTRWASGALETRLKAAAAGILVILLSHGALALTASMPGPALVELTFWPVVAIALIAWLTPSAQRTALQMNRGIQ